MNLDARLTTAQAAALVNVRPGTVRNWAYRALLDPVERDRSGRPRYRAGDILDVDHAARTRQAARLGGTS